MWPRVRPRRGQGLIEFALVSSILLLLLLAVMDLGSLLAGHLAVVNAARDGALVAVNASTNSNADCASLAAIKLMTQGRRGLTVTRIVIYSADSQGNLVSGALANVYLNNPGCPNPASPPTPQMNGWLPSARTPSVLNIGSLGVQIEYTYTWQTTAIAVGNFSGSDHVVMPLIPG